MKTINEGYNYSPKIKVIFAFFNKNLHEDQKKTKKAIAFV